MSLRYAPELPTEIRSSLGWSSAEDVLGDPRGWTVRCTPRRRTIAGPEVAGRVVFRKERLGPGGRVEWRALQRLAAMGFAAPAPVCFAEAGRRSVVVVLEVTGRPMDALLHEAVLGGETSAAAAYCIEVVAPLVRRLHDTGLVYRDLYWNHLYAERLGGSAPVFIDVERVFRPRWRRRRWRVKDLAGLLSSLPSGFTRAAQLRFLRSYLGERRDEWRALAPPVLRKAAAQRAHRPKYG